MATMQQIGRERVGLTSGRYNGPKIQNLKSQTRNRKHECTKSRTTNSNLGFRIWDFRILSLCVSTGKGSPSFSHLLVTKRRRLHLRNEERAGLTRRATETDAGVLSEYVEEVEGSATQSGRMIPALQ